MDSRQLLTLNFTLTQIFSGGKARINLHTYGSLYVTLCFVLRRFDFGVLTFYFRILSFLFCVLFTMLFTLNGAIYEVETRYRRKDGRKTKL